MPDSEDSDASGREAARSRVRALLAAEAPELLAFLDEWKQHFPGCRLRRLEINGRPIGVDLTPVADTQSNDET